MFSCTSCGSVSDENDLQECVHCGIKYCDSCGAIGLLGRFCSNCGDIIREKMHGNKHFHLSIPEPDIAKREKMHLKFNNIDLKDKHELHISFNDNHLDSYTRAPLHLSVPEPMKPKETLSMKFPELLMEPKKHELHMKFEDHSLLHKRKKEELHVAFPENFMEKDVLVDMALKKHKD